MAGKIVSSIYSQRAEDLLSQIETKLSDLLVSLARVPETEARRIAYEVANSIAADFPGELVYFTQTRANRLRNEAIIAALDRGPLRGNYTAVGKKFHLTESAIRKIESTLRSAELANRQSDLFQAPT